MLSGVSPKQMDYLRNSTARVNISEGSIRSGKTMTSLLKWAMFVPRAPRGGELVMVGRTRDAVWRNNVLPLQDVGRFGEISQHVIGNYGAPTVKILGRTVHVMGAADTKAEKVLRGMTVSGVHADELTTLPREFFVQLLGRMSVAGAQMFGSTNPDNPSHWLKSDYLDKLDTLPKWRHWHFTLEDNPTLDEEYKDSIRTEYTGLFYRRFILGEWVAAEGAIFDAWDPDQHVIPHDDLPDMQRIFSVGMDYGTTNATTAIAFGLGRDGDLYAVDEWRYEAANVQVRHSDPQLSAGVRGWLTGLPAPPEWVIVDPAAASFKVQLGQDGILNVMNGENDVLYGIRAVASLLSSGRLKVSDRCAGLVKEMPAYVWDPKATEKGEDKPIKVADHSIDALRYAIATTETEWRPYIDM